MPRLENEPMMIDGDTYRFGYLQTSQSLKLSAKVSKHILPVAGPVIQQALEAGNIMDLQVEDFIKSVNVDQVGQRLAAELDPAELQSLIQELCSVVSVEGVGLLQGQPFEEHFKGRPGVALQVASRSFEVNCKDFFASAVSLVGKTALGLMTQVQAK